MKRDSYANFVDAVAFLKEDGSTGQLLYPYAVAAAAWDDIYEHARKSGEYSPTLFGFYRPALDRLLALSPPEFPGYDQILWYRSLIDTLIHRGVDEATRAYKQGAQVLAV